MKYVLCKASVELDYSHAELWYANPDCILEKPHKIVLFSNYQIDCLMGIINTSSNLDYFNLSDLPLDMIPEQFKEINAEYVEVPVGLHKHASRKIGGRPVFTRCMNVFVPLVRCKCSGEHWRYLYDPRQLAQEQINRYWIPVDED